MNKIIIFFFVFLISAAAFGQTVSEKLIVKLPSGDAASGYDVKYDRNSGSFAYQRYDTTTKVTYLITAKGKTSDFSGVNTYNAYFDKQGNVYCAAYNIKNDTEYTYSLLKNTDVLGTYDLLYDNWAEKDGKLYFAVKENGKTSFASLDLSTGTVSKGKGYDDVMFVYYPKISGGEGEPVGYPGFTTGGKPYYLAVNGNKKMMVVDGVEQKAYADIDMYTFTTDKNGDLTYVANDKGMIYDSTGQGNTFLVQGDKEYKKFDNIYGPVIFDNNNNPIYIGATQSKKDIYPQTLMSGNNELSKEYSYGISFLQLTPSGKLSYVGSKYVDSTHFEYYLVIDGKEGKKFDNISNVTFTANDLPVYIAGVGDKQFIMKGDSKISDGNVNILDYKLLPGGELYFSNVVYGDYNKGKSDKYFIHIGDDKYGPYETIMSDDYSGTGNYIQIDNSGNYGYVASKLVDKKNYIYEYTAYTGKGNSDTFDNMDNMRLINGKVYFLGYKTVDKKNFISKARVYCDLKPISGEYENIVPFTDSSQPGLMAFTGSKGSEIYYIEVK